jgi:superfamily II DNA or RNA helicase
MGAEKGADSLTGKTRIVLEFVREFRRRRGRCSVLVVVPMRVLAYNPWKKEIDRSP